MDEAAEWQKSLSISSQWNIGLEELNVYMHLYACSLAIYLFI